MKGLEALSQRMLIESSASGSLVDPDALFSQLSKIDDEELENIIEKAGYMPDSMKIRVPERIYNNGADIYFIYDGVPVKMGTPINDSHELSAGEIRKILDTIQSTNIPYFRNRKMRNLQDNYVIGQPLRAAIKRKTPQPDRYFTPSDEPCSGHYTILLERLGNDQEKLFTLYDKWMELISQNGALYTLNPPKYKEDDLDLSFDVTQLYLAVAASYNPARKKEFEARISNLSTLMKKIYTGSFPEIRERFEASLTSFSSNLRTDRVFNSRKGVEFILEDVRNHLDTIKNYR